MVGNCNTTDTRKLGKPLINVLLIEDNLAEARLLLELLKGSVLSRFNLVHTKRLGEAIELLEGCIQEPLKPSSVDVILLDLTLPDSDGLASLDVLVQKVPSLPIVVLTNTNDNDLAVEAVRHGAQDYLFKRQINHDILVRSLHYAIERKQTAEALREANEILELRVQERTAALETANQLLRQEVESRQKMQERLELAQQAGKIGSFDWNLQSNEVTWTAELEALYSLPAGSFEGQFDIWLQTLHPDDRAKTERALHQAVRRGQGLNIEFRILCPTGETRWIAVKSSIFCDQTGDPLRMIGIHMDITEKKQLEAQFLRAQRLESLGTLASGIAHDLNNVLTPILAVSQLLPLKIPNLDNHSRQLLTTLETSAHRGAELVKQILSFARGVEGKRVNLQIHHLLLEVRQIVQQTLPKSIDIQIDLPPSLWTIFADATQLHQVFMNLCINARDAMPQSGTLCMTAENRLLSEQDAHKYLDAKAGPYVVVTISDTGMGISPTIIHHIFDPFFTTKEIGKGTGLGLSAVLGIVKSHGGFIDVQSEVDRGSEFTVYLPASESTVTPAKGTLEPLTGHQELILVVDDEMAIREITKTTLESYNYQVLTASDGIEALSLFAAHKDKIHGVLMDIMMPSMDGLTLIPLLRQYNPSTYMVAMSGLSSTEAVSQAEQLGCQNFLPKPFSARDLLQILHTSRGTVGC